MGKKQESPFQILLFYKYVSIEDHEEYAQRHLAFCQALGVKGRILVAHEGINGTISGTYEQTEVYMTAMHMDLRFSNMEFKIDPANKHAFKKIFVRPKEEIVHLGLEEDINPAELTGKHLSPKKYYKALQEEDVVVLDARNDYEHEIGHFQGAICPPVKSFRDLPDWIRKNLSDCKDKKILTYCTGGIRCEKLTGFMLREGFEDVSQLEGGIIKYSQDSRVKGELFEGKCYVFDERIVIPANRTENESTISSCCYCQKKTAHYVDCTEPGCPEQFVCCEECEESLEGICQDCRSLILNN